MHAYSHAHHKYTAGMASSQWARALSCIHTDIHAYIHTYMHTYRWYGIFAMGKGFVIGVALGVITTPESNSAFLFGIFAVDFLIQAWFQPQVDIYACASEVYAAGVQVS
jgi:hypothetical protein